MNYPLYERSEGFYYSIALMPDWVDRLARQLDMESLARANFDESERVILHFHQLGYSAREIAWYYGTSQSGLNRKLRKIFERLADLAAKRRMDRQWLDENSWAVSEEEREQD